MNNRGQQEPRLPWDKRPVSLYDWVALAGIVLVALLTSAAILGYAILNPPRRSSPEITAGGSPSLPPTSPDSVSHGYPPLSILPAFAFPDDNLYSQAKYELGKMLFFDTRLSGDGSISCNSCHPAGDGSWAVATPISFGYPGSSHWRNASTLINVVFYSKLNWDGGKPGLEAQAEGAWKGAVAGNIDGAMAEERLAQIPEYVALFREVFGTEYPLFKDASRAVAAFQRTLVSQNVPFDDFLNGNEEAISGESKRGYALFKGKANCIACHNGPLISDDSYHNTGVPTPPGFANDVLNQITFRYEHWAKGVTEEDYATSSEDMGLYYVTKLESDIGKFRTPALRDVCYTAPYMHNGVFSTLEEVVGFYDQGGGNHANKDPLLRPLALSEQERTSLVAFLESLCGDKIIIEKPALPDYAPWTRLEENGK